MQKNSFNYCSDSPNALRFRWHLIKAVLRYKNCSWGFEQ